jgi:hypothetical protein
MEEFHSWSDNFMTKLAGIVSDAIVPPDKYKELVRLSKEFNADYDVAEDPNTRTSVALHARNRARKLFEYHLRLVIRSCLASSFLVTDEQRELLGLPIRKKSHERAKVAKTPPHFEVSVGLIRHVVIKYGGSKTSNAKPDGQHGVEIAWLIAEQQPDVINRLHNSTFCTSSPIDLEFNEEERGKTVWFALRWENTRGEKGPYSAINSAIIP